MHYRAFLFIGLTLGLVTSALAQRPAIILEGVQLNKGTESVIATTANLHFR